MEGEEEGTEDEEKEAEEEEVMESDGHVMADKRVGIGNAFIIFPHKTDESFISSAIFAFSSSRIYGQSVRMSYVCAYTILLHYMLYCDLIT